MNKKKIIVLDDVLSIDSLHIFSLQHFNNIPSERARWVDKGNQPQYITDLIKAANDFFDLSNAVGYEWWTQNNTYSEKNWHYDSDESVIEKLKSPLCSIIYYPFVADLNGGFFSAEDIKIKPKTNRMIIMAPEIMHRIEPYNIEEATRWSFLINPWTYKLEAATPSWHIKTTEET
jgi:hypothetical protein